MIDVDRKSPEFKPLERDTKNKDRLYFCVSCGDPATQTAHFKADGYILIERYCDNCASKYGKQNK